jgi:hypothetical protein
MSYNGKYGWFDKDARHSPTSNEAKYLRDKSALQEMLQDLHMLHNCPGALEDQLVHALVAARKSHKLGVTAHQPIWCAFALQIYLDILYSIKVRPIVKKQL